MGIGVGVGIWEGIPLKGPLKKGNGGDWEGNGLHDHANMHMSFGLKESLR